MEALDLFHRLVSVARPKQRRYRLTSQPAMDVNRSMDSILDDMEGHSKRRSSYSNFEVGVRVNELLSVSCFLSHSSPQHMLFCMIDVYLFFFIKPLLSEFLNTVTLAAMTGHLCFY